MFFILNVLNVSLGTKIFSLEKVFLLIQNLLAQQVYGNCKSSSFKTNYDKQKKIGMNCTKDNVFIHIL